MKSATTRTNQLLKPSTPKKDNNFANLAQLLREARQGLQSVEQKKYLCFTPNCPVAFDSINERDEHEKRCR